MLCPECHYATPAHPSSSLKIALWMLDVFMPTCRAISASDRPTDPGDRFDIVLTKKNIALTFGMV